MFAASTILYKMIVCLSESRGGSSFGESIFSYCWQRYLRPMQNKWLSSFLFAQLCTCSWTSCSTLHGQVAWCWKLSQRRASRWLLVYLSAMKLYGLEELSVCWQKTKRLKYIENNTWVRGNTRFISSVEHIYIDISQVSAAKSL
jgi:hypothetical protein